MIDQFKLHTILSNLLENAIKFTHKGYVKVICRRKNELLELQVEDTGIGIDSEHFENIFNRFVQESKLSREYGGLGLGLSIAKENALLLEGNIYVQSNKGEGTTFTLTLPYQKTSNAST